MFYCFFVLTFSLYMIYRVAPKHGTSNPLVYVSICSLVGSVSVMAVKGFGVALKLTFGGNNQLWRAGTWIFAFTVAGCIAVQMNYFVRVLGMLLETRKALLTLWIAEQGAGHLPDDRESSLAPQGRPKVHSDAPERQVVNPSYYVCFSSSTLIASVILFRGLNSSGAKDTFSLLCGLFIISLGIYLLVRHLCSREHAFAVFCRSCDIKSLIRCSRRSVAHSGFIVPQNLSRSENEAMAARRYSSAGQRQSLLQESRLSFVSDGGNGERVGPDARRSATLYRAGGITMGGVEPLFDYEEVGQSEPHGHGGAQKKSEGGANGGRRGETAIQMEQFSLQNDDDDDDDSDSDREVQASQYNHHQQQRR